MYARVGFQVSGVEDRGGIIITIANDNDRDNNDNDRG